MSASNPPISPKRSTKNNPYESSLNIATAANGASNNNSFMNGSTKQSQEEVTLQSHNNEIQVHVYQGGNSPHSSPGNSATNRLRKSFLAEGNQPGGSFYGLDLNSNHSPTQIPAQGFISASPHSSGVPSRSSTPSRSLSSSKRVVVHIDNEGGGESFIVQDESSRGRGSPGSRQESFFPAGSRNNSLSNSLRNGVSGNNLRFDYDLTAASNAMNNNQQQYKDPNRLPRNLSIGPLDEPIEHECAFNAMEYHTGAAEGAMDNKYEVGDLAAAPTAVYKEYTASFQNQQENDADRGPESFPSSLRSSPAGRSLSVEKHRRDRSNENSEQDLLDSGDNGRAAPNPKYKFPPPPSPNEALLMQQYNQFPSPFTVREGTPEAKNNILSLDGKQNDAEDDGEHKKIIAEQFEKKFPPPPPPPSAPMKGATQGSGDPTNGTSGSKTDRSALDPNHSHSVKKTVEKPSTFKFPPPPEPNSLQKTNAPLNGTPMNYPFYGNGKGAYPQGAPPMMGYPQGPAYGHNYPPQDYYNYYNPNASGENGGNFYYPPNGFPPMNYSSYPVGNGMMPPMGYGNGMPGGNYNYPPMPMGNPMYPVPQQYMGMGANSFMNGDQQHYHQNHNTSNNAATMNATQRKKKKGNRYFNNGYAVLFAGQLSYDATTEDVEYLFSRYGELRNVVMFKPDDNNRKKPATDFGPNDEEEVIGSSAFISYGTTKEADLAIISLHDKYCMDNRGKKVQVSYCLKTDKISQFGYQHAMQLHNKNPANPKPIRLPTE